MTAVFIIAGIAGIAIDNSWIAGIAFAGVLYRLCAIYSDMELLRGEILEVRRDIKSRSVKKRRRPLSLPQTASGREAKSGLEFARNDLSELFSQNDTTLLPLAGLSENDSDSQDELSLDEYYEYVVGLIRTRFRCCSAVIAFFDSGSERVNIKSAGAGGERFKPVFEHYLDYCRRCGWKDVFGPKDAADSPGILGGFQSIGCRYTLSFPFGKGSEGMGFKGILWLGYPDAREPSASEIKWARLLCERIGSEGKTREKFAGLYEEIKNIERENKLKHEFIANMSHDIRAPLNNVKNILTLVKLEGITDSTIDMIEAALDNCDQMAEIIGDLLDFSRHQVGKLKAVRSDIDLCSAAARVVNGFLPAAQAKGIVLGFSGLHSGCTVHFDPKHLRRVLTNIIDNAVKYTLSGKIEVSAAIEGDAAVLRVKDSGVGMSAKEVERLYEPFVRFDERNIEGVGLGLTITRILVELNSGEIAVRSQPGVGTEVKIIMESSEAVDKNRKNPMLLKQLSREEVELKLKERELVRNSLKVLIVDDDPAAVDVMVEGLKLYGYEAMCAYSVNEAAGILKIDSPDAIITDSGMPNGGGRRILGLVSKLQRNVPVIVVSGRDGEDEKACYRELGAGTFFSKPVEFPVIAEWLKENVSRRKAAAG